MNPIETLGDWVGWAKKIWLSILGHVNKAREKTAKFLTQLPVYINYAFIYSRFWTKYGLSYIYSTKIKPFRLHGLVVAYWIGLLVCSVSFASYLTGLLETDGVTFFTSAGAMFGGIIAIFFSVSTLLMQSAAQSTSAGFYKLLGRDIWQEVIYWIISFFAIISFSLALLFSSPHVSEYPNVLLWASRLSILTIGTTFFLLFVLYFRIYERINPRNGLLVIRKDISRHMRKLARVASESSELITSQPSFEKKQTPMATAAGMSFVTNNMSYVSDRLDHLFDYHNKLVRSEERKSARIVIDVVTDVLKEYFGIISGGSVLVPSVEHLFVTRSNSEKFLTPHLQGLVSVAIEYMNSNDDVGTSHVVWKMCHLTLAAADIKYATYRSSENPIFAQCLGYLTQLTDAAVEKGSLEGVFQAAQVYAHVGIKAVTSGQYIQLRTIYASLNKIALHGLVKKHSIVWQQVANTYREILQKLATAEEGAEQIDYKGILESYEEIVMWAIIAGKTEPSLSEMFLRIKMEEVFELIPRLAGHLAYKARPDEERGSAGEFFELVEENRRMLRRMSEKMQSADHFLLRALGNNIRDIGLLLLDLLADPKWEREHAEVSKNIGWYIHQPEWFMHHAKGTISSNSAFDSLVDAVAKIGIQALDNDKIDIAEDAGEILSKMAMEMMEKEELPKYGYTEPRIMEKVCYIGILAQKKGHDKLLQLVMGRIKLFEDAYKKKYFSDVPEGIKPTSPSESQLSKELLDLREKVQKAPYESEYSMHRILDLPEDWMVERINLKDFDTFTLKVWGFFATPSPLDAEIPVDEKGESEIH